MNDTVESLMQAAAHVARLAGDVALGYQRKRFDVETKADGTPVTIADREAESTARDWIARRFPRDGIVGEEHGATRAEAGRRWIIDPIDGTQSFIRGVPLWGTLIAVAEGEDVLAGAACFPALDEIIAAGRGCGAWWNDARCAVSGTAELEEAAVLVTDARFPADDRRRAAWSRLAARARLSRTWGDAYGYLLVATGRAEVMVDDALEAWDAAALQPIIEEAGGVFTDWRGRRTAFGGDGIATNLALAAQVRDILGAAP